MENFHMTKTELIIKHNLVKYRTLHNLSIRQAAQGLQMDYAQYHKYENLSIPIRPRWTFFETVAAFYGISVADLFIE